MNKHPILASLLSVVCTAMLFSSPSIPESWAATSSSPGKITYQGFLTDQAGVPIGNNGPVNRVVIFRIFGSESGSDLKWSSQQTVTVDKGHFSVLLGEGGASSDGANLYASDLSDLFTGSDVSDRFLELEVEGTKIAPRMQFLSAPYALLARMAQSVTSPNGSNAVLPADDNVTVTRNLTVSGTLNVTSGINVPTIATAGTMSSASANVTDTVTAGKFVGNGTIPIGGIIMWSGNTIPAGWALCDGQGLTPDLRDRFVVGSGGSYQVKNTGGKADVVLYTENMPSHSHALVIYSGGAHEHTGMETARADNDDNDSPSNFHVIPGRNYYKSTAGKVPSTGSAHKHSGIAHSSGGGLAHENRPPFFALAFIMRVQ